MKKEFLGFLDNLMAAAPDETAKYMNDNAKVYIEALRMSSAEEKEKPTVTDNGRMIMEYMKSSNVTGLTAKRISDGILLSSKVVSGAMRKLVTDEFVEKIGENPTVYVLTDKGKNYKFD